MSSRQLRKLQQQRELEQAKLRAQEEEAGEESEDEIILRTKPKASLFANLAALQDEENEGGVADEDEGDVDEEVNEAPAPPSIKKAKKSKSKKKKKAQREAKETTQENERDTGDSEDIDAVLRELDLKESRKPATKEGTKLKVDPEYEKVCALLSVSSQHLKVANEMRRLFGKDFATVDADVDEDAGRGGRGRRPRELNLEAALKGTHAPGKGLSSVTIRRNALIEGKQDWPKDSTGGLTISVSDDKADDGTVEFRFVHDATYQSVQQAFHAFVEIGDPGNLIKTLQQKPYHISLLIQVSKVAKNQGDHFLSSDLLERALFTFGRAATSVFNNKLSQGKARLDFARPENREFWQAGYHYIKSLAAKGTYRTALEWAKLLLSLDPEGDPYSMRLMIHELALRAGEDMWLLEVGESEIPEIWAPEQTGKIYAASHTTPSLVLAALRLKEAAKCRELLSDSMQKLPWLFVHLFKELSLDAPKSIWGIMPRTDAETMFTELYVRQTKDLWNTPEVTALLMEIAHTIPKVNLDDIPKLENKEMTLEVARFLYLEQVPSLMSLAPSSLLHRANNSDSDPLPPDLNVYSYEAQRERIEGRPSLPDDAFYNPFAAIANIISRLRELPNPHDRVGFDDLLNGEVLRDLEEGRNLRAVYERHLMDDPPHLEPGESFPEDDVGPNLADVPEGTGREQGTGPFHRLTASAIGALHRVWTAGAQEGANESARFLRSLITDYVQRPVAQSSSTDDDDGQVEESTDSEMPELREMDAHQGEENESARFARWLRNENAQRVEDESPLTGDGDGQVEENTDDDMPELMNDADTQQRD